MTGDTAPGQLSPRKSNSMKTHIGWTRISTCLPACAILGLPLFLGSGVAAAASADFGLDSGMWVQVTGLPNDPKKDNVICYEKWDTSNNWDSSQNATNGAVTFTHLTTEGHQYLDVECVNNGTTIYTGTFMLSQALSKPVPPPPAPAPPPPVPPAPPPAPAAAPADPLGTVWTVTDTGGAPKPWKGTWTRVGTTNTWNWTESNPDLPGQPTASGTATMTFDGTTVRIHRLNASSPQTCDYTGTPTGSSITGLFTGFSGTVNCSNSGIINMPWSATIQ